MKKAKNDKTASSQKKELDTHRKKCHKGWCKIAQSNENCGLKIEREYLKSDIIGFDDLLCPGIPVGSSTIITGGPGTGKTIFCLQLCNNLALQGKKCLYMSFEEREERLVQHMEDFGWDPKELIRKGLLKISRTNVFDITRNVDGMLAQQKGELLIEIDPVILPDNFKPDVVVLDSLTAVGSAFFGKPENYRIYLEQLFRFFEKNNVTSLLITEVEPHTGKITQTGVEEFLSDAVIMLYNFRKENLRASAIEILKMRGVKHNKKVVSMQIEPKGIVVYTNQDLYDVRWQ